MVPPSQLTLWIIDVCLVVVGWLSFTAVLMHRPHTPRQNVKKRDKRSWYGIGLEFVACGVVSVGVRHAATPFLPIGSIGEAILTLAVAALFAGSLLLVRAAVSALGRQWSLGAQLLESHELVMHGAYGIVRHPIYTGMIGMFLGSAIAVSSWWALLAGGALFIMGTALRVRAEEELLTTQFGEAYRSYARRVPALIPGRAVTMR